jgi:hypothetical protein
MYRLFLLRQGKITGYRDIRAGNDALACLAAARAFDECPCDDLELWASARLVVTRANLKMHEITAWDTTPFKQSPARTEKGTKQAIRALCELQAAQ